MTKNDLLTLLEELLVQHGPPGEEREIDAKGVGAPLSVARIGWARAA